MRLFVLRSPSTHCPSRLSELRVDALLPEYFQPRTGLLPDSDRTSIRTPLRATRRRPRSVACESLRSQVRQPAGGLTTFDQSRQSPISGLPQPQAPLGSKLRNATF